MKLPPLCASAARYLGAALLCVLIQVVSFRLWDADLTVPIDYGGDSLLTCAWVKGLIDHGWYLHNPDVGLPGGLDMHDFPLAEGLHFGLLKLLALAMPHYAVVVNLYYLLTFPLAALAALFAFRRCGAAFGPALVGGLLFAFLPYHLYRSTSHLFLSAYYLVPFGVLLALRIYPGRGGRPPGLPGQSADLEVCRHERRRLVFQSLAAVLVSALIGSAGVYYAFFTCFFLLAAGTCAALARRQWTPFLGAGLLTGVISAAVAVNVLPALLYTRDHGPNPEAVSRSPVYAEMLALKPTQLVLPVANHFIVSLARVREKYDHPARPCLNENSASSLGMIGSLGLLLLLGRPFVRGMGGPDPNTRDGLTLLNLAAILLATMGGAGSLLALFGLSWMRAYNRISIFIGFFALAAVALLLTKLRRRVRTPRARVLYAAALGVLLAGGILDQRGKTAGLPFLWLPGPAWKAEVVDAFRNDAEFVAAVEARLPARAAVFQLPYMDFPEHLPIQAMLDYDHFRGYLHSHTVRWSYGAMRGRDSDHWQRDAAAQPPDRLVEAVAGAGFAGIYLDRNGYADKGAAVEAELTRLLGAAPVVSRNARLVFFDLTPHTAAARPSALVGERGVSAP